MSLGNPQDQSFLGVSNSLRGREWQARLNDNAKAVEISQKTGIEELVGRVLAGRGISADDAADHLNPTLRTYLPDPLVLAGMEDAALRIARAVSSGEQIAIFGDYDVDGATSSAVLSLFMQHLGVTPRIYIPDRMGEGYGPNVEAFGQLAGEGASLIITVDCGTASYEALAEAARLEVDVVVLDHHLAEEQLPTAHAIVNPNRNDDLSGLGQLAAVGVSFLTVIAVNRILRQQGFYAGGGEGGNTGAKGAETVQEPDLLQWLDLVALGTICDVVPLTGINRALVAQGLKVMSGRRNIGITALMDVARASGTPDTYHAGFVLGPRINAAGRIGDASLGVQLLTSSDEDHAASIAARLDVLNGERKAIEERVVAEAMEKAETQLAADPDLPILLLADQDWHPGLIGIAAGRVRERFDRPAIVMALGDNSDEGKGSGRSVPGVDLGSAIRAAAAEGLILKGGGHPVAAGLSLRADQLEPFSRFMIARLRADVEAASAAGRFKLDGAMTAGGATLELIRSLGRAGPYGNGNPQPRFAFPSHQVAFADIVGVNHVRCRLRDGSGAYLSAIAFRAADTPLGKALLEGGTRPLHVAGTLKIDAWQGREQPKLFIDDAAWPERG